MNSTELESKKKEILNVCLYQLTGVKNYMEEMNIRNCVDYAVEKIIKATANCGNCEHRDDCVYEFAWDICDKWNLYSNSKEN